MPTEDAYSSGHLVLSHFGTCMCSNVETNLSWTCLVSGLLNFEHPSVLLFCFTHFWMYGVLCYLFACFIYSVCTAHAVPWWEQNFSTETMCVCWLLLGRIISFVENAQYASNQSKRGQPEKYQLILSRVCGAELDAKPWRCEDDWQFKNRLKSLVQACLIWVTGNSHCVG